MSYAVLSLVIETKDQGVKATYQGGERLLWPKAIGQTNGNDRVICRELEEDPPGSGRYKLKAWRCFAVDDLTCTAADMFFVQAADRPQPKWKVKHVTGQNCVRDIDVFR